MAKSKQRKARNVYTVLMFASSATLIATAFIARPLARGIHPPWMQALVLASPTVPMVLLPVFFALMVRAASDEMQRRIWLQSLAFGACSTTLLLVALPGLGFIGLPAPGPGAFFSLMCGSVVSFRAILQYRQRDSASLRNMLIPVSIALAWFFVFLSAYGEQLRLAPHLREAILLLALPCTCYFALVANRS